MRKLLLPLPAVILLTSVELLANKTSVEIKAPSASVKGTEVTVTINVTHKGNSKMHHTDWVWLKVNGQEVKRWEFSKEHLPAAGDFTLEYKITVTDDLKLEAEGHCNIHGTAGAKSMVIKAE
ncbi:MAG TPA: desulfoferrodoxin family protein [Bacteroidales bacterium]|nr:hypothetical protein [Bacteroidales bacterium]HNR41466.1 desulfoferrodoxin family protein [Bacteroidales bacterium]HPM17815.1 desulfoferrodoxin family protein [Bacteroidales bacterium]